MTVNTERLPHKQLFILLTLALPTFMVGLDLMILSVALKAIQDNLQISNAALQWLISGYSIGNASFLITAGRLTDIFTPKRCFLAGVILFTLASGLIFGLAHVSIKLIILLRILQGMGGGMLVVSAIALVMTSFPQERRNLSIGVLISSTGLGMALGPIVGGYLIHLLSWPFVFLINVPLGLLALLFAWLSLPQTKVTGHSLKTADLPGALLLMIALVFLILFLNTLSYPVHHNWKPTLVLLFTFIVTLTVLIFRERRTETPILAFKLFQFENFLTGNLAGFFAYVQLTAFLLLLGLYFQSRLHMSVLQSAYNLIPFSLSYFIFGFVFGQLSKDVKIKTFVWLGFALSTAAYLIFAAATYTSNVELWWLGMLLFGIGFSSINNASIPCAISFIPASRIGQASGTSMMFRWLGGAIGASIVALLLDTLTFREIFSCIALIGLVGFGCALAIKPTASKQ